MWETWLEPVGHLVGREAPAEREGAMEEVGELQGAREAPADGDALM